MKGRKQEVKRGNTEDQGMHSIGSKETKSKEELQAR